MIDLKLLDDILSWKKVTSQQVVLLRNFIAENIDPKIGQICSSCPAQIRFAHQKVVNWNSKNKSIIDAFREAENKDLSKVTSDIEGYKKVVDKALEDVNKGLCLNCDKDTGDKRKLYCSKKCRKKYKNGTNK